MRGGGGGDRGCVVVVVVVVLVVVERWWEFALALFGVGVEGSLFAAGGFSQLRIQKGNQHHGHHYHACTRQTPECRLLLL